MLNVLYRGTPTGHFKPTFLLKPTGVNRAAAIYRLFALTF